MTKNFHCFYKALVLLALIQLPPVSAQNIPVHAQGLKEELISVD